MRNKAPLNQVIVGKTIPVKEYKTLLDFSMDTVKDDYEWVCIEMGGTPLDEFVHPPRALYILGSEDNGVSSMLRSACKHVIELPAVRSESFNVAVAGTMVMYDRYVKSIGK
jgi:tRNA G18 (ribose-2'-O)-methylase SpoU